MGLFGGVRQGVSESLEILSQLGGGGREVGGEGLGFGEGGTGGGAVGGEELYLASVAEERGEDVGVIDLAQDLLASGEVFAGGGRVAQSGEEGREFAERPALKTTVSGLAVNVEGANVML